MGQAAGDKSASPVTCHSSLAIFLCLRLRLAQARDAFTGFALAALFEERRAFKTL